MNKAYRILISIAILVVMSGCVSADTTARIMIGETEIDARVVSTPLEQARGLAGVTSLSDTEGMLFNFDERNVRTFWMKGMLIPIDIIWIDRGEIVGIEHSVPAPTDPSVTELPLYSSRKPVSTVLEVRAGLANDKGLSIGDAVIVDIET